MKCGACIRWRRRPKAGSRFGFCKAPVGGKDPYWKAEHPTGDLMTADVHGAGCDAFKEKRR